MVFKLHSSELLFPKWSGVKRLNAQICVTKRITFNFYKKKQGTACSSRASLWGNVGVPIIMIHELTDRKVGKKIEGLFNSKDLLMPMFNIRKIDVLGVLYIGIGRGGHSGAVEQRRCFSAAIAEAPLFFSTNSKKRQRRFY